MHVDDLWDGGAKTVLRVLKPIKSQSPKFPNNDLAVHKHPDNCTAREALEALICSEGLNKLRDAFISPNILFLGKISFDSSTQPRIESFSFQAYASPDIPIEQLKGSDSRKRVHYFRFEHHPIGCGGILSEHPIHLHVIGNEAPRMPVALKPTSSPLFWFLEFLCFNYDSSSMKDWIEYVALTNGLDDEYTRLSSAFGNSTIYLSKPTSSVDITKLISAIERVKSKANVARGFSVPLESYSYSFG